MTTFAARWFAASAAVAAGLVASSACTPKTAEVPVLTSSGYRHPELGYLVVARQDGELVADGWRLDNLEVRTEVGYRVDRGDGHFEAPYSDAPSLQQVPTTAPDPSGGERFTRTQIGTRAADEYWTELSVDTDGDGAPDLRERAPMHDLRFVHDATGARIWLRTFPVGVAQATQAPPALLAGALSDISARPAQASWLAEALAPPDGAAELRFEPVTAGQWAGRPAAFVDGAVGDATRVQLTVAATELEHAGGVRRAKVWLGAGFVAPVASAAALGPEYLDFLRRVTLDDRRGVRVDGPSALGPTLP